MKKDKKDKESFQFKYCFNKKCQGCKKKENVKTEIEKENIYKIE